MKYFLLYYCCSGMLSLCYSHYKLFIKKDEKTEKLINKMQDMGADNVYTMIYIFDMLLGFILLPVQIIAKLYKLFTGKEIIDTDDIDI